MVLVIDNYDSFTFNLVQYLGEMGASMKVFRNDQISSAEVQSMRPEQILISPGPRSPAEAGRSNEIIKRLAGAVPILGVCLGHQCIAHCFGARIVRGDRLMHGKTSPIEHHGKELFAGIPSPFNATRYHSLIVDRDSLPACLEVTARTPQGEIMGLRHKALPIWGVQFHPESILTQHGKRLLANFLRLKGPRT